MQTYIILPNNVNQSFTSQYIIDKIVEKKDITLIKYDDTPPNIKICDNTTKYIDKINNINMDQFNWNYYVNKYNDLTKVKSKTIAWEHWLKFGSKENRNPFDRRTVVRNIDINYSIAIIQALINAIDNKYENILIIHVNHNKNIMYADFQKVINEYHNVIQSKNICIFSYLQTPYAYLLKSSIFKWLLSEVSYFIYKFDEIIKMYIRSYDNQYQIFNHTSHSAMPNIDNFIYDKINTLPLLNTTGIDINKKVTSIRSIQFVAEYEQLLQNYTLTNDEITQINYIMCQLPYDSVKYKFNSHMDLNFYNYLKLLMNIINNTFYQKIDIAQSTIDLYNFNTIYFDYEFYLQLYPCYKDIFKNQTEAYNHYLRQGAIEKLICNELIFELIQKNQEYLKHQMINNFDNKIQYDHLPILYDTTFMNYYNHVKPLIYIITRTSNRENLFKECCDSILEQKFVNIRHIVSYDTESTKQYINQYTHIYKTIDLTTHKSKIHPNLYMDVIYEYLEQCEPGWVLILDDDDKLLSTYALYYMEQYMNNNNNLLVWMLYRPDKFIYPKNKENPIVGEIGSCCYIHHTSLIRKEIWQGTAIGDFSFFKYLFDKTTQHIYIDYPLTGINYKKKISGWSAM